MALVGAQVITGIAAKPNTGPREQYSMIIAHPESVGTAAAVLTVKVALTAAALLPLLVCKALSAIVLR
jgi:hypothetical protein